MEELAPELAPMLTALEMPANFVPVTNAVLSEMARRGVSRDKILATLRAMGSELPLGTLRMLQWAQRTGIDVRVLSDCNTLFIGHILTGAVLLAPFPLDQSQEGFCPGRQGRSFGGSVAIGRSTVLLMFLFCVPAHALHILAASAGAASVLQQGCMEAC